MHLEQLKQLAEESWEGCDGCTEQDKNFWAKGFLSGHCTATIDCLEFLQWLEVFRQAKQMEKEQITKAFDKGFAAPFSGDYYYNETFNQ